MADALVQFREGHNCPLRYGQEAGNPDSGGGTVPTVTGITEGQTVSGTVPLGATAPGADAVDYRTPSGGAFVGGFAPDFAAAWDTSIFPNGPIEVFGVAWKDNAQSANGPSVHVTIAN
jgi:hypothetical protein